MKQSLDSLKPAKTRTHLPIPPRRLKLRLVRGGFLPPPMPALAKDYWLFLAGVSLLVAGLVVAAQISPGKQRLQKQILGTATTGFEFLDKGKEQLLRQNLAQALQSFTAAKAVFQEAQGSLTAILPGLPVGDALTAGQLISQALENFTLGLKEFQQIKFDEQFFAQVRAARGYFVASLTDLGQAEALLDSVNLALVPAGQQAEFESAKEQVRLLAVMLEQFLLTQDIALNLFGGEAKTYLVLFQNNAELRATGGFPGTYGIVKFSNGQMQIDRIESIYVLDGQLRERIAPPGPLTLFLTDRWGVRDSNWFVDFPLSARKALEFYEKETGQLADGVLAVTPDAFEDLLTITGPIALPEYGESLSADNFRERVQFKTSLDYDREQNQPKKFLADFAPRLLERLGQLEQGQTLAVFEILTRAVLEKQILAFSLDKGLQADFERLGLAGTIRKTDGDFLAVFHSSVGGGKTSLGISEDIRKSVTVNVDGTAFVELAITRKHQDFDEHFFPRNTDFLRVLVPPGSKLISASGFDDLPLTKSDSPSGLPDPDVSLWQSGQQETGEFNVFVGSEASYTEFSGWLALNPGQERTVKLIYELPFRVENTYTQLLQKQPGSQGFYFSLNINFPGRLIYTYPQNLNRQFVSTDSFYAAVGE